MKKLSCDDEREIRDLIVWYSDGLCRKDTSVLRASWSSDCRLRLPSLEISGREAVLEYQMKHMGWYESLLQVIGEGILWATESGAEGRWIVWEIGRRSGAEDDRVGVVSYSDKYTRENGRWAIAERFVPVHYNNEHIPAGTFNPLSALPPLQGPGSIWG